MKRFFITRGASFVGLVRIGNPNECSILDLAKKVIGCAYSKSKLVCLPLPKDDLLQGKPLIDLAKNELNRWSFKFEFNGGLTKRITHFDSLLIK
jgi:UDP-glucuronate decarboxylase